MPDKKYDDSYLRSYHHKNPKTNFKSTAMSLPNYKEYDARTMYSCTLPDKKYSDNDRGKFLIKYINGNYNYAMNKKHKKLI
jgi:hypothetical protein